MWFLVALTILFSLIFPFNTLAHSESVVIRMTPKGFEPQSVTLDQNSTILFSNEDTKDRWPASNIHPTHDIYPQFDPKKPISPGSSWPFKPKEAGEWKYHDHLNPHIRGTLIVKSEKGRMESDGKALEKIFLGIKQWLEGFMDKFSASFMKNKKVLEASEFTKLEANDQIKALEEIATTKGTVYSWQYIKDSFKGQSGSTGNIHDLAHFIGGLIYEKENFKGLSKCSPDFAFGCYHGFLDKAFQKNLDQLKVAEEACKTLGEGGPTASCIHGIGHGVASFYQTADLKASLASCKRLSPGGLQYCFDGVFMEFERAAPLSLYSKYNPYKPCDALEREFGEEFSFACGRNQPTVLMSKFKFSFEDVIGVCLKSPSEQFKTACFDALGFIITKSTSNANEIIAACKKIGVDEYILRCAKAGAGELIFQEIPVWQTQSPLVCKLLSQNYQAECLRYLDDLIRQYGRKISSQDENEYIRKELAICYGEAGRDNCYKDVAQIFFNQFGLKKTLNLLEQNESYPEVYARCHEVTHYLSRSEYERLGSIAGVYAQCNSTCHGGCYHGTLEAYLKSRGLEGENLKKEFVKMCGNKEDYSAPLVFNECLHGLGHAAMFITDMDLPISLSLCDTLMSQDKKDRCFSGVFMENSSSSTSKDHKSRFVKEDDPFYPCNSLEEKYLTICWRYQSSYFSIILNQDFKKVSELCLKVPEKYQSECFRTIGTNQVGFTQDQNVMRSNCELAPRGDLQNTCLIGVVSSFAYRFVNEPGKMIQFCSQVGQNNRKDCFRQIGASFSDWTNDKEVAKAECRKISDSEGTNWCLSVI